MIELIVSFIAEFFPWILATLAALFGVYQKGKASENKNEAGFYKKAMQKEKERAVLSKQYVEFVIQSKAETNEKIDQAVESGRSNRDHFSS